jgi:multicomponent K+:H+ antiporter subunit D
VAGLFAILTKVGVYALLRLWTLCFPEAAGASAHFGSGALIWGGLATLAFGAIGMLASQQLARLAAYSVIASSGTLIAAIGFDAPQLSMGALYYLVSSTLAGGAMFMLVELLERSRQVEVGPQQLDDGQDRLPAFFDGAGGVPPPGVNLDDNEDALIGRAIPGALAFLGVTFGVCAGVVAGLPPFSGFVAKLAMLQALLHQGSVPAWCLFGLVIASGLFAATALVRVGIRHFWGAADRVSPRLRVVETLPIGALLAASVMLVVWGEPALRYARDTADALHSPDRYIRAVMSARPLTPAAAGATP